MDTFRTLIIPDANVDLARQLCALEAGGAGMFTTGLSADGKAPATHYISSGVCPKFVASYGPLQVWVQEEGEWVCTERYPGNPKAVYAACQQPISEDDPSPRVPCTLEQIEALFAVSDMTDQDPWVAMSRTGLKPVQQEETGT